MTDAGDPFDFAWLDGVEVAITLCDRAGICRYMNERAARQFAKDGGRALIGTNLLDCHPEPSRARFAAQLATPTVNTYTIEKEGQWKLIHQLPWWRDGQFAGVVELSFAIPAALPHFPRG
jgi:PAS domain-containing protein